MATERQIAANRRNAARSTGPKSAEGKDASRRNALTHGLTGSGVVLSEADEATIADRLEAWAPSHGALPARERWVLVEMVRESARIDRCHEEEWALRRRSAERAEVSWDEDRRDQAEALGRQLSDRPSLVARKLARTPQGCRWLLERWIFLRNVLVAGGDWDDDQRRQAQDLLGVPAEFRAMPGPLDLPGRPDDPEAVRSHRLAVARAEADRLAWLIDGPVGQLDQSDRRAAASGIDTADDPAVARLRRYHAACHRRLAAASKALASPGRVADTVAVPSGPPPLPAEDVGEDEADDPVPIPEPARSPVEPARPLNRHQRRALARRRGAPGPARVG